MHVRLPTAYRDVCVSYVRNRRTKSGGNQKTHWKKQSQAGLSEPGLKEKKKRGEIWLRE